MSEAPPTPPVPDVVVDAPQEVPTETVIEPAKVMRIGSMVKQLLEEVRTSALDEASRERLAEIYERSIVEVSQALSPDLQHELPDQLPAAQTQRDAQVRLRTGIDQPR